MNYVFGKTLICRSLDVASEYASSAGVDCVTLDGDKVARKGALTGGYLDDRASKLALYKTMVAARAQLEEHESARTRIDAEVAELTQAITTELGNCQRLEAEQLRMRSNHESLSADVARLDKSAAELKELAAQRSAAADEAEAEAARLGDQIAGLERERGSELESQLDADDEAELQSVNKQLADARLRAAEGLEACSALEQRQNSVRAALQKRLRPQAEALGRRANDEDGEGGEDGAALLEAREAELAEEEAGVAACTATVGEHDRQLAELAKEVKRLERGITELETEGRERGGAQAAADKRLEQIMAKRARCLGKQEELLGRVREVGALPQGHEAYLATPLKRLYSGLAGVNKKLKAPKFRAINSKAIDQFMSFSAQREALLGRQAEQGSADESIDRLITVLDAQKDEAIWRTFKQVSKYFSAVFEELVPGGKGELVLQRKAGGAEAEGGGGGKPTAGPETIASFTGVSCQVSFNSKASSTAQLQQLSGGQKTVCALALIFAINKADAAPFYRLDEIADALDTGYRRPARPPPPRAPAPPPRPDSPRRWPA